VWFTTRDGDETEWHYPVGQTMDRFAAVGGNGLLLLHAPGNTFIRDLAADERILIQPGALVWKDESVAMFLHFEYPGGDYWYSSARWQAKTTWLALQGPGRVISLGRHLTLELVEPHPGRHVRRRAPVTTRRQRAT